jgi:uncharacterized delta-60 repeat protein
MSFGGSGTVIIGAEAFGSWSSHDVAYSVAVDSLDRIIIVGTFDGLYSGFQVLRLTAEGQLDISFDGDGRQAITFNGFAGEVPYAVAVDSQDRIVVAGKMEIGSGDEIAVARLNVDGSLDIGFDGDGKQTIAFGSGDDVARAVAIDGQDRVVVAGLTRGSTYDFAVARLTVDGALDSTFDNDGKQTIAFGAADEIAYGVAVDSLGRIVVAGLTGADGSFDFGVARLTVVGALDTSFDGDGKRTVALGARNDIAYSVAVDSLNRILLTGSTDNGANTDIAVARLTAGGALDTSFDGDGKRIFSFGDGDEIGYGVAITLAGQAVVGGHSIFHGRVFALARLTGDTTTVAAQVNDGSVQRSRVTSLTVRFSGVVTFNGTPAQAFTLVRNDGGAVNFVANVSTEYGGTVVTLSNFTGVETQFGSLRDGRYTLTAFSSMISADGQPLDGDANGTPGGNFVFGDAQGLFRFFGDINGDRNVDIADFALFSGTYGLNSTQSGFISAFDFNGDGVIDIADFGQFAIRIFTVLP